MAKSRTADGPRRGGFDAPTLWPVWMFQSDMTSAPAELAHRNNAQAMRQDFFMQPPDSHAGAIRIGPISGEAAWRMVVHPAVYNCTADHVRKSSTASMSGGDRYLGRDARCAEEGGLAGWNHAGRRQLALWRAHAAPYLPAVLTEAVKPVVGDRRTHDSFGLATCGTFDVGRHRNWHGASAG